ncbi:ATP-dependent zinc metalloprotease FtsH [bacterium]|nr:ATP-dependent zinc metalloprotease FtsH [bacterium]
MAESDPNQEPKSKMPRKSSGDGNSSGSSPTPPWVWLLFIGIAAAILWAFSPGNEIKVDYAWFLDQVRADNVQEFSNQSTKVSGRLRKKTPYAMANGQPREVDAFVVYLPSEDLIKPIVDQLVTNNKPRDKPVDIDSEPPPGTGLMLWITFLLPSLLFIVFIYLMMRRARDQFDGGILGNFIKSPAKRHDKSKQRTTFDEVAGLENAKAELQEIVEFLKNPERFQRLGGRIPKGVLLVGSPGSGKTLLARAVAGEAGVPFYSISGSEFIQMFVGVGASRVRDMFKTAKESSPCILFIDEIDAVGRIRGAGLGGGHDEREQTLNQILTEMDGFSPNESVIVLAATNRPDVLDPALLRPGRFDRHVTVDRPSRKGRLEILKVHTRKIPLADDVDLDSVARGTVGMSGADLANLANESALIATRANKDKVTQADFEMARDKVLMGAKREEIITDREKELTAYHEAGHALVAWICPFADPVHKVTIIPRGRALGVTQFLPEEERMLVSQKEIYDDLAVAFGGRAAERVVYSDMSAGAAGDLKQATRMARMMVTQWGMSERVGPVHIRANEEHPFLGREMSEPRDHSEHMAQIIDEEIARILREADHRAIEICKTHRDKLDSLAQALIDREELNEEEIRQLWGERVTDKNAPLKLRAKSTVPPEPERNVNGHPAVDESEAGGMSISPSQEGL